MAAYNHKHHLLGLYLAASLIIVAKSESMSSNFMPDVDSDFTVTSFIPQWVLKCHSNIH